MKGRLKVAPEVLMWLMKNTVERDFYYKVLRDNLNLKLFFEAPELNIRFSKKSVWLTIERNTIKLSLEQFKEEFASKAKLYFNSNLNVIYGEEKMIEKFERLIKRKFGENSIKIEDIIQFIRRILINNIVIIKKKGNKNV